MPTTYEVRIAPGCCRGDRPVLSRHRTLDAAVRAARRSDRTVVERSDSEVVIYHAQARQPHPQLGWGLHGGRDTRDLDTALSMARAADEIVQR